MINKLDGGINIDENGFVINCKLTKDRFVGSALFNGATSQETNSYTHYYLLPKYIGNVKFQINLIFNPDGKILNVFLSIYETDSPGHLLPCFSQDFLLQYRNHTRFGCFGRRRSA